MNACPAWRRYALLAALFTLGLLYLVLFNHFRRHSRNFLDTQAQNHAESALWPRAFQALPQQLVFNSGRDEVHLLGAGWWPPGEDGTGLVRSPGHVLLPLYLHKRDLQLDLTLDAYAPAPGAEVSARVDGQELARWKVGTTPRLDGTRIMLPAALVQRGPVDLELHIRGPVRANEPARLAIPGAEIFLSLRELRISHVEP